MENGLRKAFKIIIFGLPFSILVGFLFAYFYSDNSGNFWLIFQIGFFTSLFLFSLFAPISLIVALHRSVFKDKFGKEKPESFWEHLYDIYLLESELLFNRRPDDGYRLILFLIMVYYGFISFAYGLYMRGLVEGL